MRDHASRYKRESENWLIDPHPRENWGPEARLTLMDSTFCGNEVESAPANGQPDYPRDAHPFPQKVRQ